MPAAPQRIITYLLGLRPLGTNTSACLTTKAHLVSPTSLLCETSLTTVIGCSFFSFLAQAGFFEGEGELED